MELKFDPSNPNFEYITEMKRAEEVVELLFKEKAIGIDTETTDLDPYYSTMLMIQVGTEDISYIFDARTLDFTNFPRFKELLETKSVIKILHNAKFDYKQIKAKYGIETDNIYDTMLVETILNAGLGKAFWSLKKLAQIYAGIDMEKAVRKTFSTMSKHSIFTDEQLRYGALDTLVMFPIFKQQLVRLKKEDLLQIAKLEFASTRVVAEMELRGIYIDRERWIKIIEELKLKRDAALTEFQNIIREYYNRNMVDLFGNQSDVINTNSQAQILELFNKRLGIPLESTGDELLSKIDHPVARKLREYRKYEKLISAFGDSLLAKINRVTGRLHPEFNQLGTATGRFSCNNPNLQQIPRNSVEAPFRECFNPAPGFKLVTADYSSFEMRILASLSKDEKMTKALNEGLDLHSYTAALMFNIPYTDDFKKLHPDLRQIAKPIGFGLMYGMGAQGLAGSLAMTMGRPVPVEEAEDYMNKYFSSYPSVKKFLDDIANKAVRLGYSTTPAGRKRWYDKPAQDDPEFRRKVSKIKREAKNHPIQGTNADAVKYALVYLWERLKTEGVKGYITHTVHDEIVMEIEAKDAERWAQIQSDEMVRAAYLFIKGITVVSEPFVGDVWEH